MNVFRHAAVVSFFTGTSRMLGFVREVVMAHFFGTSLSKSVFDVAFRIPNLFRNLLGEGALSAAFVPVFAETLERDGREEANRLAGRAMTMLVSFLILITIAGTIIITIAMRHVEDGGRTAAVLPLLRIMFPYTVFICVVALCMGILNAVNHFSIPAATPVILNLVWIAAAFLLCPRFGNTLEQRIFGIAWAVLGAGVIQLAVQVPALLYFRVWPRWSFSWNDPRIHRVLLLMGPVAVGMGVHQINIVIDGVLALWAGPWAPAALSYAERLIYLPLGIFATALGTVLLPAFSKQAASNCTAEIPITLARSLTGLMLVMTPAAAGLMILATPIVRLAYQAGHFDELSTVLTARALVFYAPGLVVFSISKLLVPAFYAVKDTRTPVQAGMAAVALNFSLNVLFVTTFPTYYKHAGLALATVIAAAVNGILLARLLIRRVGSPGWRELGSSFLRVLLCTTLMTGAIRLVLGLTAPLTAFSAAVKTGQAATVGIGIATGAAVYAAAVLVFCRRECQSLRHRRKRTGSHREA
jgi:putative peptidoglycan lipid II flippase